jgi:hypothetical protein
MSSYDKIMAIIKCFPNEIKQRKTINPEATSYLKDYGYCEKQFTVGTKTLNLDDVIACSLNYVNRNCLHCASTKLLYHSTFESNQIVWWVESGNGLTAYDKFVDGLYNWFNSRFIFDIRNKTHIVAPLEELKVNGDTFNAIDQIINTKNNKLLNLDIKYNYINDNPNLKNILKRSFNLINSQTNQTLELCIYKFWSIVAYVLEPPYTINLHYLMDEQQIFEQIISSITHYYKKTCVYDNLVNKIVNYNAVHTICVQFPYWNTVNHLIASYSIVPINDIFLMENKSLKKYMMDSLIINLDRENKKSIKISMLKLWCLFVDCVDKKADQQVYTQLYMTSFDSPTYFVKKLVCCLYGYLDEIENIPDYHMLDSVNKQLAIDKRKKINKINAEFVSQQLKSINLSNGAIHKWSIFMES